VLGAFGDPVRTGKPVGQDLREGKPTPLLAVATERAAAGQLPLLDRVGDPDLSDGEVAAIQEVLVDTGALTQIEQLIDVLTTRAVEAIEAADVTVEARDELVELAWFVASRDS
jgi:geranylgeranyl diphosphate synthase type I